MGQLWVSGTESPPLKDESALSVMLRIATSNALTRKQTLEVLLQRPVSNCDFDLFRIGTGHAGLWGRQIGWQWEPPEIRLMAALPELNPAMWTAQIRWCPACIGFGFHAIWFQLTALAACPIHGCALMQTCAACGAAPGPYRASRELFVKPYHCPSCGIAFSDCQRCSLEKLAFFRRAEEIERTFSPLAKWHDEAARELAFLGKPDRRLRSMELPNYKARILDGAIRKLVPVPRVCVFSKQPSVCLRSWSVRLLHGAARDEPPARYGLLTSGAALGAYLTTMRSLTRCVMREAPGDLACEQLDFDTHDMASLDRWQPTPLALVMTRSVFEEPFFLSCNAPLRGAALRDSIFVTAIVRNFLLRITCRALVLSTFLAMRESAENCVERGFILRRDLCVSPDDSVVLAGNLSMGMLYGMVALPDTGFTDAVACGTTDASALAVSIAALNEAYYRSMDP